MGKDTGQKKDSKRSQSPAKSNRNATDSVLADNLQLKRKIFDFYTILEMSRNFNAVLDLQSLLRTTLSALNSQIKSQHAVVFQKTSGDEDSFELAHDTSSSQLPIRCISLKDNPDFVNVLRQDTETISTGEFLSKISNPDEKTLLKTFHPGLVVPLLSRARLNGILIVGPKPNQSDFTDEDKEFLSLLCSQMSVAVENARLYEAEKKAIAELQSTQEQLVHSERLAALGEMSAKIAHEINNPLGIIKNYLTLIGKAQQDPTQSYKYLEIVGSEIDRITNIVRELLHSHRPQHVDYRRINVLKVLEEVLKFLDSQLEQSKIELTRRFSPECPEVDASAENLKQVFINVILNAIDALPEGGTINVTAVNDNGNLIIQIQDSGPGVSDEMLPRMFEPFFTSKEEGKGTGLGLSVCYGIIKKHHGSISFKNTDVGGCVEIKLPGEGDKNE